MTTIGSDLRMTRFGVVGRLGVQARRLRRLMPGPALVRLVAMTAAGAALALATPVELLTARPAMLLVPAAIGVGLFPRTRWVTLTALLAVLGWLLSTLAFDVPVEAWRVGLLAAALYVMHSSAALAAVLPYDCLVTPGTLLRWLGRTLGVIGISVGVGLAGLLATQQIEPTRSVVGPIAGSVVAALLAGVLAWHLRRRDQDPG
jgi:hypothetical protein